MLYPPAALERAITICEVMLRADEWSDQLDAGGPRSSGAPPGPRGTARPV